LFNEGVASFAALIDAPILQWFSGKAILSDYLIIYFVAGNNCIIKVGGLQTTV
jgi:hypothetical protein